MIVVPAYICLQKQLQRHNQRVTAGDNMLAQFLFGVDGVKRIELNMGGSGAISNITFTAAEMPSVPVPAAMWLFGSGLIGLVGFARRIKV